MRWARSPEYRVGSWPRKYCAKLRQGRQVCSGMFTVIDAQLDWGAFEDCAFAAVAEAVKPCCEGSSGRLRELVPLGPQVPSCCQAGSNGRYAQVRVWCPRCVHAENEVVSATKCCVAGSCCDWGIG